MSSTLCSICERINQIKDRCNPFVVSELKTGYVVLGDFQFYKGYTLFLYKEHIAELHQMGDQTKLLFLDEMSMVAEAVFRYFKPVRLNYELLGNTNHHLHWHIFPRYNDDPFPKEPVWNLSKTIRCAPAYKPTPNELEEMKQGLLIELHKIIHNSQ